MQTLLTRRAAVLLLATLALAACDDDPSGPIMGAVAKGVVILNGFGQQGVSSLDTALTTRTFTAFDAAFDGGGLLVERDTAVSTSSKGGGDKLYVADLATSTLRTVQLPAASNPGGVAFLPGAAGTSRFAVALRDSGMVAVVGIPASGQPTLTRLFGAGLCPSDVFVHRGDTWSVDANANCRSDYSVVGPTRLIRMAASGVRDTVTLAPVARGSGPSVVVIGDIALVATPGEVNFATGAVTTPPFISRVSLTSRERIGGLPLPSGFYGAGLHLGRDGRVYVASYDVAAGYATRIFALDPDIGAFVGTRVQGQEYLSLLLPTGAAAKCVSATADAAGQIYCASNGQGGGAAVLVFSPTGAFLRSGAAGQGAVDIALR